MTTAFDVDVPGAGLAVKNLGIYARPAGPGAALAGVGPRSGREMREWPVLLDFPWRRRMPSLGDALCSA